MDDLRNSIGIFFALLGGLLLTATRARAPLTDAPVNLYTGGAMLAFGGAMLVLARLGRKD
jgi:hypothetical protein